MSREIEEAEKHLDWPQPHHEENLGHAAACVTLSAAAMEAAVNEIYLQAVDANYSAFPGLSRTQVDVLASLWDVVDTSRAQTIKKHEVALAAVGKAKINRAHEPSQSAESLVGLRDLLMHFKPEWDDELNRHLKLERRLEGKFLGNQLSARATGHMLWFPGRCLGSGCATWACRSAWRYHTAFVRSLGAISRFPATAEAYE